MEFTPTFRLRYTHDPDQKQGTLLGDSGPYTMLYDLSNRLRAVVDPLSQRATNTYGTAGVAGARVVIQSSATDCPRFRESSPIAKATCAPLIAASAAPSATPPFSVIKPPAAGPMVLNDQHVYKWLITKAWFKLEELHVPEARREDLAEDAVGVLTCKFLEKPA